MSRSKNLIPTERSYHKEYSCETSKIQQVKLQGQCYGIKNFGTNGKVLSIEKLIRNIKALILTFQKLLVRLKFPTKLQNDRRV